VRRCRAFKTRSDRDSGCDIRADIDDGLEHVRIRRSDRKVDRKVDESSDDESLDEGSGNTQTFERDSSRFRGERAKKLGEKR